MFFFFLVLATQSGPDMVSVLLNVF